MRLRKRKADADTNENADEKLREKIDKLIEEHGYMLDRDYEQLFLMHLRLASSIIAGRSAEWEGDDIIVELDNNKKYILRMERISEGESTPDNPD